MMGGVRKLRLGTREGGRGERRERKGEARIRLDFRVWAEVRLGFRFSLDFGV